MKVVLFCGGMGMRMREYSENTPKPLVPIGYRPIIWHVMKYYAHFGHKDFILCLGHRGDLIKDYFLNYNEAVTNDFVMRGREIELLSRDIDDWNITFAETGLHSNIGMRLKAAEPYLAGEDVFLAHYTDIVTDLDMNAYLNEALHRDRVASFVAAKPPVSFHLANIQAGGVVNQIKSASDADLWQNGGFFVLKKEIFRYLGPGEELVLEPFNRLIAEGQLVAHKHKGFWASMDTFKEKQTLDELHASGNAPWEVWKRPPFPYKD